MIKAYSNGNYFLLMFPGKPEPLQDSKSRVIINLIDDSTGLYSIESPKIGRHEILLSDLEDQGGTPYDLATWESFYYANSAFSSAPSSNGALKVVGFWDANTNSPDLSSLSLKSGEAYQVATAGSTNLNGQSNWDVLDLAVWNDSLAGNWFKIDNTDNVISVNGQTGAVTITKSDVGLSNVDNTSDLNKPISNATQSALNLKLESVSKTAPLKGSGTAGDPLGVEWVAPKIQLGSTDSSAGIQAFAAPAGGTLRTIPEGEFLRVNIPLETTGVAYDGSTVNLVVVYNLFSAPGVNDEVEFQVDYLMGRDGINNYSGPGVSVAPVRWAVGSIPEDTQKKQIIGSFTGNPGDTHVQITINRNDLVQSIDYTGDFDIYALLLEKATP